MAQRPLQPLLDRLVLRSSLGDAEQAALLDLPTALAEVPGGYDLVALGSKTDASYLVVSGVIGRFSQMRVGSRQIVALHIAGDMADLCSVALPKTSWALHSLTASTVLRIARADLIAVADHYPEIAMAFWRDCVADMAIMSEWMMSLSRRTSVAKLAHLVCELYCRYKHAGQLKTDGSFTFPVTQTQLAEVLGMTSIHLNRMIRSLREQGLATVGRPSVAIRDWPALARLAEFDPAYLHLDGAPATLFARHTGQLECVAQQDLPDHLIPLVVDQDEIG